MFVVSALALLSFALGLRKKLEKIHLFVRLIIGEKIA